MEVSKEELHILRHSLGLTRGTEEYRNRFVTNEDTTDFPHCESLREKGLMERRICPHGHFPASWVYWVTEEGRKIANQKTT